MKRDLKLRLIRHFLGAPGNVWHIPELRLIFQATNATIYRQIKTLVEHDIIAKLGKGYALNPYVVSELRGNVTEIRKIKERIDATTVSREI